MKEIIPGIFQVELRSNAGGTGIASVFLIPGRAGERSLIIDAGYAGKGSRMHLEESINQLGISYEALDVFITHKHHDHCGGAGELGEKGAAVYMSQVEDRHRYDCLSCNYSHSAMQEQMNVLKTVGVTREMEPEIWNKYMEVNDRVENNQKWLFDLADFPYSDLVEGQRFHSSGMEFITLPLKGHTLGQMGLYEISHKVLFCADQVIDGIVPIVGTTHTDEHLLGHYFDSLQQIKHEFKDYLIVPSHKEVIDPQRLPYVIDDIAFSYLKKLDFVKRVLEHHPGKKTVKEIACLAYGMNAVPTDDQEFVKLKMVISKTFSCLEYMYDKELVERTEVDGILYWESITCR